MLKVPIFFVLVAMAGATEIAPSPLAVDLVDPAELATYGTIPEYTIRATISDERLDGKATLKWTNTTGEMLPDLVFQEFANSPYFHGAAFVMDSVMVDGAPARLEPVLEGLGVRVIPEKHIAAQTMATVHLVWHVTLSPDFGMYGLLAKRSGVTIWHAWYPEMAPRRDGKWLVDPMADFADPVRASAHHVIAEITLPDGGPLVSGGTVIADRDLEGPTRIVSIVGAYQRNLTLVIAEHWTVAERLVGKTMVRTWCRPGHEVVAPRMLGIAADAMRQLSETIAPYPYRELDVIDCELGQSVGGMESSGLVLINGNALESLKGAIDSPPESLRAYMLEAVVCHEVAHQWWYGAVGNDAIAEPWLDESLTEWTTNWLLDLQFGAAVRRVAWQLDLMTALSSPFSDGFTAIDRPIAAFRNDDEEGADVYGRGSIAYAWLRQQVGDKVFFDLLREWESSGRFQFVDAAKWRTLMTKRLGGEITERFFVHWIGGKELTAREVVDVAIAAASGKTKP